MADHALVEKHPEPEDVRSRVDLAAFDLLRGHVRWTPQNLSRGSDALCIEELRNPEVGQLDRYPAAALCPRCRAVLDEDVLRL
jgi:hypothetical protein